MAFSLTYVRVASIPMLLQWLRKAMNIEPTRANDIAKDLDHLERVAHQ